MLKKMLTPEEKIKKIFAVKKSQVKQVADDLIKEEKINLAMIGPFKEKEQFLKILKF